MGAPALGQEHPTASNENNSHADQRPVYLSCHVAEYITGEPDVALGPGNAYTYRRGIMDTVLLITLAIAGTSFLSWVWLLLGRGFYWRMDQALVSDVPFGDGLSEWPAVRAVVPARDESVLLPSTLPLLLSQDYPGPLEVILVDDRSADGTAEVARRCGGLGPAGRLRVLEGEPLPAGWTGKLWAMDQGVGAVAARSDSSTPQFVLFSDADVAHPTNSLRALVLKASAEDLDLVSVMSHLQVRSAWDRLLLPAFVYFFAKLFPFCWVNDSRKSTAAAAGGCMLLRLEALERSGGLEIISGELIDDCSLAALIKKSGRVQGGKIWLGLGQEVCSLRDYGGLAGIWSMVARTAFTQLRHSPILLLMTTLGMVLLYMTPVLGAAGGLVAGLLDLDSALAPWLLAAGLLSWVLMTGSYLPVLARYGVSPLLGFTLPAAGALFTLMTIDSARRSWQGKGGAWKGRTYSRTTPPQS